MATTIQNPRAFFSRIQRRTRGWADRKPFSKRVRRCLRSRNNIPNSPSHQEENMTKKVFEGWWQRFDTGIAFRTSLTMPVLWKHKPMDVGKHIRVTIEEISTEQT